MVNIIHPIPNEKNADALAKLVKGELKSVDTWESKLTKAGQEAETEEQKDELKNSKRSLKQLLKKRGTTVIT